MPLWQFYHVPAAEDFVNGSLLGDDEASSTTLQTAHDGAHELGHLFC